MVPERMSQSAKRDHIHYGGIETSRQCLIYYDQSDGLTKPFTEHHGHVYLGTLFCPSTSVAFTWQGGHR